MNIVKFFLPRFINPLRRLKNIIPAAQLIHSVSGALLMSATHVEETAAATETRPNSKAQASHPNLWDDTKIRALLCDLLKTF